MSVLDVHEWGTRRKAAMIYDATVKPRKKVDSTPLGLYTIQPEQNINAEI